MPKINPAMVGAGLLILTLAVPAIAEEAKPRARPAPAVSAKPPASVTKKAAPAKSEEQDARESRALEEHEEREDDDD